MKFYYTKPVQYNGETGYYTRWNVYMRRNFLWDKRVGTFAYKHEAQRFALDLFMNN